MKLKWVQTGAYKELQVLNEETGEYETVPTEVVIPDEPEP